jgi:hypothetical protein
MCYSFQINSNTFTIMQMNHRIIWSSNISLISSKYARICCSLIWNSMFLEKDRNVVEGHARGMWCLHRFQSHSRFTVRN